MHCHDSIMRYYRGVQPLFVITERILESVSRVERVLGRYEGMHHPRPSPALRRSSRVKTIQGSLAIEGNTLTEEQITAILEGKRVVGPKAEILEVQNAAAAYDKLAQWNPFVLNDLLQAHHVLMNGLVKGAGQWRSGAVGVMKGSQVTHIAPPADRVPYLMKDLVAALRQDSKLHPLVLGSIFHYELEFIHPFEDGNGRIGRLWHTLILTRYHGLFAHVPVESIIKGRQSEYYSALEQCDQAGASTVFIEFAMDAIREALEETVALVAGKPVTAERRMELAAEHFQDRTFARQDYMKLFPSLSTATASRDLKSACEQGLARKQGDKAKAQYRFLLSTRSGSRES